MVRVGNQSRAALAKAPDPSHPTDWNRRQLSRKGPILLDNTQNTNYIQPQGAHFLSAIRYTFSPLFRIGRRLICPPYSPTPAQTRRVPEEYAKIMLLHGPDERMIRGIALALEREAFLDGYYKAFAMGAGPWCRQCEACGLAQGCEHPREARPAMEACGIDVFATARGAGFPIETVSARDEPRNHFSLLLID